MVSLFHIINRLKGVKALAETDNYAIYKCLKCDSELIAYKNYGKLHIPCQCGKKYALYTGKYGGRLPTPSEKAIMDELEVINWEFGEKGNLVFIRGKCKNLCNGFLGHPIGFLETREGKKEICFLPGTNLLTGYTVDRINPWQEIEFFHYLTEEEAEEARRCNFEGFLITHLSYTLKRAP